ncbi:MAG: DUF1349 domain-containing protein [Saprospiraceae bacterium]|nr:DUF1349 domain-containing protein [Saprospiraceae bacterium]MBK8852372.1 DUF1349 domain-containing protein [Saprospiraceae bacterium]
MTLKKRIIMVLVALSHIATAQIGVILPGLQQRFEWRNQAKRFEILDNKFMITAGKGTDMFRDPGVSYNTDNAPKILTTVTGDFVASAAVSHGFINKWDGGALVLLQDSFNWVKFCFEKDYLGKNRIVSVVTREVSDDCNSAYINGSRVYLKMARKGKVVTLYYSEDRLNWTLVRHVQLAWDKDLKFGFLAQSPTGESCTATFEDLYFEYKTINDPYLGQ